MENPIYLAIKNEIGEFQKELDGINEVINSEKEAAAEQDFQLSYLVELAKIVQESIDKAKSSSSLDVRALISVHAHLNLLTDLLEDEEYSDEDEEGDHDEGDEDFDDEEPIDPVLTILDKNKK